MKRERRFLDSEVPSSIRDDSGTKKADIRKERWTVESSATALKSGLDFPVIDPIIFNLAPISFAFPPFLPFIPTTKQGLRPYSDRRRSFSRLGRCASR